MIGAAAFRTAACQKGTQLFSITMSELRKQTTGSEENLHLSEISEMTEEEKKT